MKNQIITVVTFLLLCTGIGNAQLIKSYGIKVAYTSASQTLDYPTSPCGWWNGITISAKSGFNIAVFAEWLDIPFFSIVSQVEYAQRGANAKYAVPVALLVYVKLFEELEILFGKLHLKY